MVVILLPYHAMDLFKRAVMVIEKTSGLAEICW